MELYDMTKDAGQFTSLAKNPEYASVVKSMQESLKKKLKEVRTNDLGKTYGKANAHTKKKLSKPAGK
jgi:hypothetical protein